MSEVNKLVRVVVKEEAVEAIKIEMLKAQEATRAEAGCIRYQFFQDKKATTMFYVQECYANKEAFLEHANSTHMADYLAATKGMIESVNMHSVEPV